MRLYFGCLAGLLLAGAANAAEVTRSTDAGKEVMAVHHVSLNAGCVGGMPPIDVLQAPAHGTVDIRPGRFVLKGAFAGATDCIGREVDGAMVWYIPAAGYHGTDGFVVSTSFGRRGKNRTQEVDTVTVTVR